MPPIVLECQAMLRGDDTHQRLPLASLADHRGMAGVLRGHVPQGLEDVRFQAWRIARQHQQKAVPGHRQSREDACVGAWKVLDVVVHEAVRERPVAFKVAIAGND